MLLNAVIGFLEAKNSALLLPFHSSRRLHVILPSPMLQEEGLHVKLPWSHFSSLPYLHGRSLQKLCLPFDFLIVFLVLLRLLFLSLFFMIFHMLLIIHDRLCFFLCFMHRNTGGFDLLSNAYNICLDVAVFMWSFIL